VIGGSRNAYPDFALDQHFKERNVMLDMKADFHVWELNPQTRVIDVQGELTGDAESAILNAYAQADGDAITLVVLNFKQLSYMNSSGVGLLITLVVRARREGKKLASVALPPHFQKILLLTRLNEALPIYESQAELESAIQKGVFASPPA
jgi:anti-sigma B factor antagonist